MFVSGGINSTLAPPASLHPLRTVEYMEALSSRHEFGPLLIMKERQKILLVNILVCLEGEATGKLFDY